MLTPNSLNRLDGAPGHGDPEGFLARDAFVDYLEQYASTFGMPVREHVDVSSVERHRGRFRVRTDSGEWVAKQVVVATGDCGVPYRPPAASAAPPELAQIDAAQYRRPEQLAAGSVLVVGAGPSGLQIAAELRRSGRDVVLAVGRHARVRCAAIAGGTSFTGCSGSAIRSTRSTRCRPRRGARPASVSVARTAANSSTWRRCRSSASRSPVG